MRALLTSKKFLAALAAMVVTVAGKAGLDLDESLILLIVSPLMLYIVGQGIADHGKERAKIIVASLPEEQAQTIAIDEREEEIRL